MNRIRKNDTVYVLTGRDKGKTGQVVEILLKEGKLRVKGISLVTKHAKARKSGETSAIRKIESYVDSSNVMPVCTACKKPARVGVKVDETHKKFRICNRCQESF
ncbi:MAG: 50S ribosomal protein L24 [Candidatus Babeliales bacterium]